MRQLFLLILSLVPVSRLHKMIYCWWGARIGRNFRVGYGSYIKCSDYSQVSIGHNVDIGNRSVFHVESLQLGDHSRVGSLVVVNGGGRLEVGRGTNIANSCFIDTSGGVFLGDGVGTPPLGGIFSHNYSKTWFREGTRFELSSVRIGSRSWFGPGTIISGVTVGENVVVGANSSVVQDLPSGVFALGNPAKVFSKNHFEPAVPEVLDEPRFRAEMERVARNLPMRFVRQLKATDLTQDGDLRPCCIFTFGLEPQLQIPPEVHVYDLAERRIYNEVFSAEPAITSTLRQWGFFMQFAPLTTPA